MSFRRGKKTNQTPLPLAGSTFESVTLEPFVSLAFRSESDSPDHKTVLTLVIDVLMRDSSEPTTEPMAIWKGDSQGVGVLQPLIGETVEAAIAQHHGQIEIKFDSGHSLYFEPEAEGEWRLHRIYRDKIVSSITWSDGSYIR